MNIHVWFVVCMFYNTIWYTFGITLSANIFPRLNSRQLTWTVDLIAPIAGIRAKYPANILNIEWEISNLLY